MDTSETTDTVAAEIAATNGALEAEHLDASVAAAEAVKEAMQETVQVPQQEPFHVSTPAPVDPKPAPTAPAKEKPVQEAKPAPKPAPKPEKVEEKAEEEKKDPKAEKAALKEAVKEALREEGEQAKPAKEQEPAPKTEGEHRLSTAAFKALKQKAEEKGRRTAMEDIGNAVKAAGYTSLEEALRAIKNITAAPAVPAAPVAPVAPAYEPPAPAPQRFTGEAEMRKLQRENNRMQEALQAEKQRAESESRKNKQLAKRVEAMEIDNELREVAIKTGVVDVDYAMTLLQRDLSNKSESELQAFDEQSYFKGLRDTHGHLFGERIEPASTSRAIEPTAPPSASQTQRSLANQVGKKDAMREQTESVHARIKEMGLTLPTS